MVNISNGPYWPGHQIKTHFSSKPICYIAAFSISAKFFSKFGSSINTFLILNKCLKLSQQQPTMMMKLTFAFFFHWLKCISRIKDYFREMGNFISWRSYLIHSLTQIFANRFVVSTFSSNRLLALNICCIALHSCLSRLKHNLTIRLPPQQII